MRRARPAATASALACALGALACATPSPTDPSFEPTQSVLEVVAVLQRHVEDDTYRFEPARDFTGRNVYRASLLRLESLEKVHQGALRAGHMDDVIAFAKGRALERLDAFEAAAVAYRRAADHEGPLRHEALRSAAVCDALGEAAALGESARHAPAEAFEARHGVQIALLEAVLTEVRGTHHEALLREQQERAQLARVRRLEAERELREDGDLAALAALQRLVVEHRESKHANRHLLRLADLYAELAAEYVELYPPESLGFDPPTFEELVTAAARLYEAVANQDGAIERLEAAQRLEAFVAFTLRVDRDRFQP